MPPLQISDLPMTDALDHEDMTTIRNGKRIPPWMSQYGFAPSEVQNFTFDASQMPAT